MDKVVASKLKIKQGYSLLIWNAPEGYVGKTNADQKPGRGQTYDFIQLFIYDRAELGKFAAKALKILKKDGLLWVTYPKKSSAIKTDITRDYGWEPLTAAGLSPVTQVAIDGTWSALRFKANNAMKVMARSTKSPSRQIFDAILEKDDKYDGTFVSVPFNVAEVYG